MKTTASAASCSSCGSLYTPAAGDRGLCTACHDLVEANPPSEAIAANDDGGGSRFPLPLVALAAGGLVVIGGAAWLFLRGGHSGATPPRIAASAPVPAPASSRPFARPSTPAPVAALVQPETRPQSPAQAALSKAEGQLQAGKPKAAEKTLKAVLRKKKIARADRAAVCRLMGAAEARRGHKKSALAWYRKSLKMTKDPAERDQLAQHIKQLSKARKTADIIAVADTL